LRDEFNTSVTRPFRVKRTRPLRVYETQPLQKSPDLQPPNLWWIEPIKHIPKSQTTKNTMTTTNTTIHKHPHQPSQNINSNIETTRRRWYCKNKNTKTSEGVCHQINQNNQLDQKRTTTRHWQHKPQPPIRKSQTTTILATRTIRKLREGGLIVEERGTTPAAVGAEQQPPPSKPAETSLTWTTEKPNEKTHNNPKLRRAKDHEPRLRRNDRQQDCKTTTRQGTIQNPRHQIPKHDGEREKGGTENQRSRRTSTTRGYIWKGTIWILGFEGGRLFVLSERATIVVNCMNRLVWIYM